MMPMQYGVGDMPFRRLQEEIMKKTRDDSILAWGLPPKGQSSSATPHGGVLAVAPSDFAACSHVVRRERPASDTLDLRGGSLHLHLRLHTTEDGETLGLLECSPSDNTNKVVGIPLVAIRVGQTEEFFRPEGHHIVLVSRVGSEVPSKLVCIVCELPTAPTQRCWLRV